MYTSSSPEDEKESREMCICTYIYAKITHIYICLLLQNIIKFYLNS